MNALLDSSERADQLLAALGEQLAAAGSSFDIAVCGGSALLALGLVTRSTRDVDVVALREGHELISAAPLPPELGAARDRVARDFDLPGDWLNSEVSPDMVRLGLPEGFGSRLIVRRYGDGLTVRFASRTDQIHFKLYAAVDQAGGKHLSDLLELDPSPDELIDAARWTRTHDPSEGFLGDLRQALRYCGADDAALDA